MTPTKTKPTFRRMVAGATQGEIVIPAIRAALYDPKFKSFTVKVEGFRARKPDGWFHPSTHPLWPERMLYYYITQGPNLVAEVFDPQSTMAVTQGQFWHSLIQGAGLQTGLFLRSEVEVLDDLTGSRGKYDAELNPDVEPSIFELKTMVTSKIRRIPDGRVDAIEVIQAFRKMNPEYYAQAQEYMRLSGLHLWRGVIISMEYPYPMREIALKFDAEAAYEVRDKFLSVRQAVADQRLPLACCAPKSKLAQQCPARLICPIGLMGAQ